MMEIRVNENDEIMEYAVIGGLPGSVEFNGDVPADFEQKFKPAFYVMAGERILINQDYKEPTVPIPDDVPNEQAEINAVLLKEVATLYTQLGGVNNG